MFFSSLLFAEGRRQQRLEFGCCLGAAGRQLFVPSLQPAKFRGEVPRSTQAPGSANTLRHKRGRTPSFTLRALPCPGASGLRELASSRPGPAGRPGGIAAGGTAARPALATQTSTAGAAGAGAQPALNAEVAAVHAANTKTSKTKPRQIPPTEQREERNHHRDRRSREMRSREARSLSAILEA